MDVRDQPDLPAYALATLLPLCRDRFADTVHGGFYEQLDEFRQPVSAGGKRLMVQCRQLYVLSHAAVLGERSGGTAAERGYAFLRRAYADLAHGGWYMRATPDGAPLDCGKDFYAHAFLLFALAWLHRAFAAPNAVALAEATYDTMLTKLAAPQGGFWESASEDWSPRTTLRRQNPHMHLLEALLALHEATGAASWLSEADKLVALFQAHFLDRATGTLGEYFAPDWSPDPSRGHIVEPGHHYEWVWLLHRYRVQGGSISTTNDAARLFAFAERHGYDTDYGGLHDQIDRAGRPLLTSRRIWPLTEAIKAHAVHPGGQPRRPITQLFRDFLAPAPGGWIETMTREGLPLQTRLPGSTPYHLFLAATEMRAMGKSPTPAATSSPADRPAPRD
jgi:mannose/cellobiose epimerase-like protein (N-acyl-D-glucosamine 2-epimerase family)